MRRLYAIAGTLLLAAVLMMTAFGVAAQSLAHRLQQKALDAQAAVHSWIAEGRDPSAALTLMQQVKPALDAGDPHRAESLLNRALAILNNGAKAIDRSPLPIDATKEPTSGLYIIPVRLTTRHDLTPYQPRALRRTGSKSSAIC